MTDFYVSSGGYDQTNVHFYKVIGHTTSGKSVRIQEWSQRIMSNHGSCEYVVPGTNPRQRSDWSQEGHPLVDSPILTKRIGPGGWLRINSSEYARPWGGKPEYQTAIGWGH